MCVHVSKAHTGRVARNAWHVDCRICNVPTNSFACTYIFPCVNAQSLLARVPLKNKKRLLFISFFHR